MCGQPSPSIFFRTTPTSPNLSICTAIRWSDDPPPSYGRYLLSSIGAIGSPASSSHLPAISLSSNQHCCGNIYDRIHSRTLAFALSALVSAVLTAHWLMTEPVTRCCPHVAVSVHTVHCCCLQLSSSPHNLSCLSVVWRPHMGRSVHTKIFHNSIPICLTCPHIKQWAAPSLHMFTKV